MFDLPGYVQNSFNVFFSRQPSIRRKADTFETVLEDRYLPPLVLPIPDDQEPEVPRIVFASKNGFSQIAISQINIALNVQYSPDFQIDISKGRSYLLEHVPVLFQLLNKLSVSPNYVGFATVIKGQFFSNMTVSNYRTWQVEAVPQRDVRLSPKDVVERGVQIAGDFNDRYAYNENKGYRSGREQITTIIDGGLGKIAEMITKVQEA